MLLTKLITFHTLIWLVHSEECKNEAVENFVKQKENATSQAIQQLQNIFITSYNSENGNIASKNFTTNSESLYPVLAASLNITESSDEKKNFVQAVDVITDAYFKACYGPESEKPTVADASNLVVEFLTLLTNRTDFTTMREIYGKLLCLGEFKEQEATKREVDILECAKVNNVRELYECLDPNNDVPCVFGLSSVASCNSGSSGSSGSRFRRNCLTFVVDTTGSMSDEIEAAKQVITSFIQSEEDTVTLCYILIAFNDFGETQTLESNLEFAKVYSASELESDGEFLFGNDLPVYGTSELLKDVNSLRADGGGDCPEYGMTGIKKALDLLNQISMGHFKRSFLIGKHNIIVLTDASAKDDSLYQSIISQLSETSYDVTVHFFFSGLGCDGDKFRNYTKVSNASGGIIVSQIDAASFPQFVEFIRSSSKSKRSASFCQSFVISYFVTEFSTLLRTEQPSVTITMPNGTAEILNTIGNSFVIYTMSNPQPGEWKACVSAGTIEQSLTNVVDIDLKVDYVEKGLNGQFLPTFETPLVCANETFVLQFEQQYYISFNHSLYLDILGDSQVLVSTEIEECQGTLSGSVKLPPNFNIEYQLRGHDIDGNQFSHQIPDSFITLNHPDIHISVIGGLIIVNPGERSVVRLMIQNLAEGPSLQLSSQIFPPSPVEITYVSDSTFTLEAKKKFEFQFTILASENLSSGMALDIIYFINDSCSLNTNFTLAASVKSVIPINVTSKTTRNITFEWSYPTSHSHVVTKYILSFEVVADLDIKTVELDNETFLYTLEGLHAFQLVYFSIAAESSNGTEVARNSPLPIRTEESEPSKVSSLEVEVTSPSSVNVSWTEPVEKNGVLIGYIITTIGEGYSRTVTASYLDSSVLLTDLGQFILYEVSVQAATSAGKGNKVTVMFYTLEGAPRSGPTMISYKVLSTTSVVFSWSPPALKDRIGFLVGYTVSVFNVLKESFNEPLNEIQVDSNSTTYTLSGLEPYKRYHVEISAQTSAGRGRNTSTVFYTLEGVPLGSPKDIQYSILSSTSISISWNPPSIGERRGFITQYLLTITDFDRENDIKREHTLIFPRNVTIETVTGLSTFADVSFSLGALTSAGVGPMIIYNISIVTGVPSSPTDVSGIRVNDSSVRLQWEYPEDPNGVILEFYVYSTHVAQAENISTTQQFMANPTTRLVTAMITNLERSGEYWFKVAARNKAGIGKNSTSIHISLQRAAQQESNVVAVSVSSTLVFLFVIILAASVAVVIVLHLLLKKKRKDKQPVSLKLGTLEKLNLAEKS